MYWGTVRNKFCEKIDRSIVDLPNVRNAASCNHTETPKVGAPPTVRAVFGTMSIPDPLKPDAARESLEYFLAAGFDEIDTAILYQEGATEETLGIYDRQGSESS